jgi:hypothetical protein
MEKKNTAFVLFTVDGLSLAGEAAWGMDGSSTEAAAGMGDDSSTEGASRLR